VISLPALDFSIPSADIRSETSQFANGNNVMTDTNSGPSLAADADTEAPENQTAAETIDPTDHARVAAEYKDKLLRVLAEMENLRRRTEREIADTRAYGISAFARDILAVADNMDRALGALDAELREKADAGVKALLDGVELTERELHKVLEKHGVKKFEPVGEKFDPNLHQAMFEVPDPSRPAGTVAQVVQPGYMIGERILRPALVAIAKGGPKASAEAPANDNAGGSSQDPEHPA
jgi:molecular chaperone GrpE